MSDTNSQPAGNTPATGGAQSGATAAAPAAATTTGAAAPAATPAAAAPAGAPAAASTQQATDGKPAGDKPAAGTDGDGATAKTGAPEKYEFKAPNGTILDAAIVAEYSALAKELGLPQDAAQKVIDKLAPQIAGQNAKAITEAIAKQTTQWIADVKADPTIGGEKLGENLAVAKKAVERFGSPELRALLDPFDPKTNPRGTGLGNHPEIIRLFHKVGKSISEDRPAGGTKQPTKGDRDAANILYPKQAA